MLKGITVILYDKQKIGVDSFGKAKYKEVEIPVENVLIGTPSTEAVTAELTFSGKKLAYELGIPKGDMHTWTGRAVSFFGKKFKVIGEPTEGIEEMIPLDWNKKVKVELYE